MRVARSVTSISWLPSEAVEGIIAPAIRTGHYQLRLAFRPIGSSTLATMARDGGFRFANQLRASVEIEDGRITPSWRRSMSGTSR